jgi:Tfp pilus assembly protein PilN
MAERPGLQVSQARMNEILLEQYQNANSQLMAEVAKLSAINEAMAERLNEYVQRDQQQVQAPEPSSNGTATG